MVGASKAGGPLCTACRIYCCATVKRWCR